MVMKVSGNISENSFHCHISTILDMIFCITAEAHCAVKVPYEQMRAVFYPSVCWLPGTIAMHLLFQQC